MQVDSQTTGKMAKDNIFGQTQIESIEGDSGKVLHQGMANYIYRMDKWSEGPGRKAKI